MPQIKFQIKYKIINKTVVYEPYIPCSRFPQKKVRSRFSKNCLVFQKNYFVFAKKNSKSFSPVSGRAGGRAGGRWWWWWPRPSAHHDTIAPMNRLAEATRVGDQGYFKIKFQIQNSFQKSKVLFKNPNRFNSKSLHIREWFEQKRSVYHERSDRGSEGILTLF